MVCLVVSSPAANPLSVGVSVAKLRQNILWLVGHLKVLPEGVRLSGLENGRSGHGVSWQCPGDTGLLVTAHPRNRHNRVKESCRVPQTPLKLPSEDGDAN
jgi:hypothetical protein